MIIAHIKTTLKRLWGAYVIKINDNPVFSSADVKAKITKYQDQGGCISITKQAYADLHLFLPAASKGIDLTSISKETLFLVLFLRNPNLISLVRCNQSVALLNTLITENPSRLTCLTVDWTHMKREVQNLQSTLLHFPNDLSFWYHSYGIQIW